jgi:two-component system, OmpR family, sensor kinase
VNRVGRLFWKFLFAYWAAMLIAVIGVGATAWIIQATGEDVDPALEAGPRTAFVLGTAAATMRHAGPEALKALMEDRGAHDGLSVLAVDEHGRDLLGRPVPPEALARARQLVGTGTSPERARLADGPGGERLLIFIPMERAGIVRRIVFRSGRPPSPLVPIATGMAASLIFGVLLSWYVGRPVRVLRGAFDALSQGRLETRVSGTMGRDGGEAADLGRDFDGMADRLQTLITAQRSLLHDVSHELRSPLARLQAAIGLARQNPQKRDASLDRIELEAQRVDALVEQLLTLSRLDAQVGEASDARLEHIDLVDLVAAIAEDARFEAEAHGRSVSFSSAGEAVSSVRAELLHRAVENVIRNAVKYTEPGTAVDVRAEVDAAGPQFVVRVVDRGPGVPVDELEAIFEPFYRGRTGTPARGFGLGLAISRRAVEAHGGRVIARNRPEGGLDVEIQLPLPGPAHPAA